MKPARRGRRAGFSYVVVMRLSSATSVNQLLVRTSLVRELRDTHRPHTRPAALVALRYYPGMPAGKQRRATQRRKTSGPDGIFRPSIARSNAPVTRASEP